MTTYTAHVGSCSRKPLGTKRTRSGCCRPSWKIDAARSSMSVRLVANVVGVGDDQSGWTRANVSVALATSAGLSWVLVMSGLHGREAEQVTPACGPHRMVVGIESCSVEEHDERGRRMSMAATQ